MIIIINLSSSHFFKVSNHFLFLFEMNEATYQSFIVLIRSLLNSTG